MAKRASLFKDAASSKTAPATGPAEESTPVRSEQSRAYPVATTRQGKRAVTCYVDPAAWKQLKAISLDEERTVQDLLVEGVNAVFEKYGRGRIA
ncbi:ribbon-helix-helix domain-containing protein [Chthonobacter albigriseus]|uniref:ribbon-helix-helix domain-containing protein n=1 Tax=Chthonobacter albigriseus TaxID=1683161 RepID=UPI003CC7D524